MNRYQAVLEDLKDSPNRGILQDFANYMEYDRCLKELRIYHVLDFMRRYDRELKGKDFRTVTKADNQAFLLRNKKSEDEDPTHRWMSTYNEYRAMLMSFYRWLYNKDKDPHDWVTPDCIRVKRLKRVEDSPYTENDTWTQEDVLFVASKVVDNVRDAFIVTGLYDFAGLPKDLSTLRIKNLKLNITSVNAEGKKSEYGEATISAKNRFRTVPVSLSYPYAKDLINTHPFRNNPDSFVLVSQYSGKPLRPSALWVIMDHWKQKLQRMVDNGGFAGKDLEHAKQLLMKPWNPNLIGRHSSLSEKTEFLTDWQLKRYAGWSANTAVPKRYLHKRDVVKPILQHYGIVQDEKGNKLITQNACPRCQFINKPDVKFCEKCSYIIDPAAWQEVKEEEASNKITIQEIAKQLEEYRAELLSQTSGLARELKEFKYNFLETVKPWFNGKVDDYGKVITDLEQQKAAYHKHLRTHLQVLNGEIDEYHKPITDPKERKRQREAFAGIRKLEEPRILNYLNGKIDDFGEAIIKKKRSLTKLKNSKYSQTNE